MTKAKLASPQPVWQGKNKKIVMSRMDDDYLQKAFSSVQWRVLNVNNDINKLSDKLDTLEKLQVQLEEEAKKRNIELKDLDQLTDKVGNFFKNERKLKEKIKGK